MLRDGPARPPYSDPVHDRPLVGVNHLEGHVYAAWLRDPGGPDRPDPVFPLVAIIAAIGLMTVVNWIADRVPTRRGRAVAATFAGVVIFIGAGWSSADYFGPYAANPQLFWEYDSGITQVADHLRGQPDKKFFLTPYDRFYEVVMLTLAEQPREPIQSYNGMACALFPAETDRVTEWLVINEKDQRTLPLLKQIYPAGQIVWRLDSPVGAYACAWQGRSDGVFALKGGKASGCCTDRTIPNASGPSGHLLVLCHLIGLLVADAHGRATGSAPDSDTRQPAPSQRNHRSVVCLGRQRKAI